MIDTSRQNKIQEAKTVLSPIIDTVALCCRMGISLRGHRDDSQYYPTPGGYSKGQVGNFIRLINFAVRHGDSNLENHLKSASKNARYLSKTIQNDIIKACGDVILDDIISEVKKAKYFSILADEAHELEHGGGPLQCLFVLWFLLMVDDIIIYQ